jgi:DNA-directed RNA polymerase specialized sigma24 family protein
LQLPPKTTTEHRPLDSFLPDERELARLDDPEAIRLSGQDMLVTRHTIDHFLAHSDAANRAVRALRFDGKAAEDAVHQAVLAACRWVRKPDRYPIPNPHAWFVKVAINAAKKAKTRDRDRCLVFQDDFSDCVYVDQSAVLLSKLAEIREAADLLPQLQKEVFIYCKLEWHTIEETARKFNLTRGIVSGHVRRAVEAIRLILGVKFKRVRGNPKKSRAIINRLPTSQI